MKNVISLLSMAMFLFMTTATTQAQSADKKQCTKEEIAQCKKVCKEALGGDAKSNAKAVRVASVEAHKVDAKANCDPANCDPSDCPPICQKICQKICGTAAKNTGTKMAEAKTTSQAPVPMPTRVASSEMDRATTKKASCKKTCDTKKTKS